MTRPIPVWEKRDNVKEINDNTVFDMKREVILAIQDAVAEEIGETEDYIFDWLDEQLLDKSSGAHLDRLAELYGISRFADETDDSLKARINMLFLRQSSSVNRDDIENILKQTLGTDEFVIIPRTGNDVWIVVPRGCLNTKQEFADLEKIFPLNNNLKISVYERKFVSGTNNTLARPMGSFFVDGDETGASTTLIYNKEVELYGN